MSLPVETLIICFHPTINNTLVGHNAVAYNRTVFFPPLAEYVPRLVDFHFPCLTMGQFFFIVYSIYSVHVWELLA
jgi:hypothetical protein